MKITRMSPLPGIVLAFSIRHLALTFNIGGKEMMKRNLMGRGMLIAALLVAGLAVAVPANAISFDLTSCHISTGCGTATSFGTVTLTQVGANVNFDVELAGGNRFVQTGSADQQLFKFNATGVVAGDIVNEATANPLNAVPGGL